MKNVLRNFLKKLTGLQSAVDVRRADIEFKKKQAAAIPKIHLENKHISGLRVLTNRSELLKLLPKNSVCAEIGVNKGEFSTEILNICEPAKLHLIDAWGDPNRYHDGLKQEVKSKFSQEIANNKVEMNIGFSQNVLKTFPDQYFDWVYLDTDHSYQQTKTELEILNAKMKPGGVIAGHDYILGNWVGGVRYGVIEAVHEFCLTYNWRMLFTTINYPESPSFAIQKIEDQE